MSLGATASVSQSKERWSRDPESRVQFPVGGLGVAFFATGQICLTLKNNLSINKPEDLGVAFLQLVPVGS